MTFIEEITKLNKESERLIRESGLNFNLFHILDRVNDEVKTHSSFIGELLNERGKHGKGNIFMVLFMKILQEKIKHDLNWKKLILDEKIDLTNYKIKRRCCMNRHPVVD